jgi:hypothetical protein
MTDGIYARMVEAALALEEGDTHYLRPGTAWRYGIFEQAQDPVLLVECVRVQLHKHADAKKRRIRVCLCPDGMTIMIYRNAAPLRVRSKKAKKP